MGEPLDVRAYNREAWNREVAGGNPWTVPVSPEVIAAARRGEWSIVLTENLPIPRAWFPEPLAGRRVLCLASGGGQQGPVLAAAGALVTVYDNSPAQLARDRQVAERDGLNIAIVEGDMRRLEAFEAESFDLIVHPVSNLFVPDVRPVWREAYRVLRRGGSLLAGFVNPMLFLFDWETAEKGELRVTQRLPYSDLDSLPREKLEALLAKGPPLEWSHSLEAQIGGQLEAGFVLAGLYEDHTNGHALGAIAPTYLATRALKV